MGGFTQEIKGTEVLKVNSILPHRELEDEHSGKKAAWVNMTSSLNLLSESRIETHTHAATHDMYSGTLTTFFVPTVALLFSGLLHKTNLISKQNLVGN